MKLIKIIVSVAFSVQMLMASAIYYSPAGSGLKSGVDRANAKAATDVNTTLNNVMQSGDTLFLTEGVYNQLVLTISSSGSLNKPMVIQGDGWNKTIIKSDWNPNSPGTSDSKNNQGFRLQSSASHWVIAQIEFQNYATAIKLANDAVNENIWLDQIKVDSTRDAFWIEKASKVKITNSKAVHYTKKGFRIQDAVNNTLFEDNIADASDGDSLWANLTESIPMGFFINSNDSNIYDLTFRRCVAHNNLQNGQTGYKNGDGFCSEKFSKRLRFVSCESYDNHDGGFDLKGDSLVIDSSISFRNYRNYRLWSGAVSVKNSIGGYARNAGLWAGNNSNVSVEQCTFANNSQAFEEDNGLISGEKNILWNNTQGDGICLDCQVDDPKFVTADSLWFNSPTNAFNSKIWSSSYGYYYADEITSARQKYLESHRSIENFKRSFDIKGRVGECRYEGIDLGKHP